jgi:TonB family protein
MAVEARLLFFLGNPFLFSLRLTAHWTEIVPHRVGKGASHDRCISGAGSECLFDTLWGERWPLPYEARAVHLFSSWAGRDFSAACLFHELRHPRHARNRAQLPKWSELPLIFSGHNGGGGGNRDPLPAWHGNLPRASLDLPIVPPTVILPKEPPKLAVDETVMVAPTVSMQGGQIGDPTAQFSRVLSNGAGGLGGIGTGCCNGIGPSSGPGAGAGPPGIFPAGKMGVTVPEVIFDPEPSFSDEARKAKAQGIVLLFLVVGKDGHTYDVRVGQSLGMGLDEKAIEAVNRWRFRPATLNGQPVATQIAVQVDFHLY